MDVSSLLALSGSSVYGATAGLRVLLPLFLLSMSATDIIPLGIRREHLPDALAWLGSFYAVAGFGAGYALERLCYFNLIPIVDHVVDFLELFLAPLAGALLSIATIGLLEPSGFNSAAGYVTATNGGGDFPLAVVGFIGGLFALVMHVSLMVARWVSTRLTGGCANGLVGILEDVVAVALFILALVAALAAFILLVAVISFAIYRAVRALANRRAKQNEAYDHVN